MEPFKLEIYPYGKNKKIRVKTINIENINIKEDLHNFTNNKYIELFNDNTNYDDIISNILQKIMTISKSKDGFIAFLEEGKKLNFKYYCMFMDLNGFSFKSQNTNCSVELSDKSLLTRGIVQKMTIISNDIDNDPRSIKNNGFINNKPNNHILIKTFCGIPLIYKNKVLGQIGLANSKKYKKRYIRDIIPLQNLLSNFLYLSIQKKLDVEKNLELRKQVNILKDSFIATMSHEIRTPLNGIVGMASLLKEAPNLTSKQQDYLHILLECSTQLMELVNDILDYSKISSGGLVLINESFNLKNCIYSVRDIVIDRAKQKGLDFKIDICSNLPENLLGDSKRIKQILFNLITNAIKFTEKGSIELIVNFQDLENENKDIKQKQIDFTIIDTGIGIKKEDQSRIFEVFTKINKDDSFYTNTTPGVGMGLAITKFLVEQMRGNINVESDGLTGSKFTFNIVLEDETDIKALVQLHESELKNKCVVVVDDNEDNRLFLMDTLFSWGIKPIVFSSPRECINYINKYKNVDATIIDLSMVDINGIELAQSLREKGYKNPIIAISNIDTNTIGKDWFDYFHVKPITKSILFNILLRCFFNTKKYINNIKLTHNIIVAEDDHYNQVLMKELLETIGYKNIKIVSNGQLCLDEIKKEKYDICLMDVKMPVMDGLEATRLIKKLKKTPIIIGISASVLEADKNKCFSAGMDGYIPKPIQKQQLETILKSLEIKTY
jgi:signal transduction histidine kinase/DNA-binding response OmpR family regulator